MASYNVLPGQSMLCTSEIQASMQAMHSCQVNYPEVGDSAASSMIMLDIQAALPLCVQKQERSRASKNRRYSSPTTTASPVITSDHAKRGH